MTCQARSATYHQVLARHAVVDAHGSLADTGEEAFVLALGSETSATVVADDRQCKEPVSIYADLLVPKRIVIAHQLRRYGDPGASLPQ